MFSPGDIVTIDFPGVTGVKRRPVVVLSSEVYHKSRPDIVVGLITSQVAATLGPTDCLLKDWSEAGLRVASAFRSFLVTLPPAANPVFVGRLSQRDWKAVRACVKIALATLDEVTPS